MCGGDQPARAVDSGFEAAQFFVQVCNLVFQVFQFPGGRLGARGHGPGAMSSGRFLERCPGLIASECGAAIHGLPDSDYLRGAWNNRRMSSMSGRSGRNYEEHDWSEILTGVYYDLLEFLYPKIRAEIARHTLRRDFRSIRPERSRILLVEGGPHILAAFPERLRRKATASLERLGVEVRTGSVVTGVDGDGIHIGAERIQAETILWAAGVAASLAAEAMSPSNCTCISGRSDGVTKRNTK